MSAGIGCMNLILFLKLFACRGWPRHIPLMRCWWVASLRKVEGDDDAFICIKQRGRALVQGVFNGFDSEIVSLFDGSSS